MFISSTADTEGGCEADAAKLNAIVKSCELLVELEEIYFPKKKGVEKKQQQ